MKILISELPKSDWWGRGMPAYKNNWLMKENNVPRPEIVRDAHHRFVEVLQKRSNLTVAPFPGEFDMDRLYKHDFIFVRDSYISIGRGRAIISNFSERQRQDEAEYMKQYLSSLSVKLFKLSADAYAEGGEFYLMPEDNLMFAGLNRNNQKGVEEVARISGISHVCTVRTSCFHLDTSLTVLLGTEGHCVGVIGCLSAIENPKEVLRFCDERGIRFFNVDVTDGMGTPENPGSLAINCLATPGTLYGCAPFATPGIEDALEQLAIAHVVVPLYDLKFSGGSVHCLTNELEMV